ncbi:hypothetical protein K1T71_001382 [Dendrolimus kikuchii]|uniref:Uncharacterized protein n=1 Tax=Dendrolimus kikuchii TaxID=765133 RepID=A0ACC1DJ41_9NEOP|nr:hypothetical protein K1T71_001382 [Dendrolimus kikuchii]
MTGVTRYNKKSPENLPAGWLQYTRVTSRPMLLQTKDKRLGALPVCNGPLTPVISINVDLRIKAHNVAIEIQSGSVAMPCEYISPEYSRYNLSSLCAQLKLVLDEVKVLSGCIQNGNEGTQSSQSCVKLVNI